MKKIYLILLMTLCIFIFCSCNDKAKILSVENNVTPSVEDEYENTHLNNFEDEYEIPKISDMPTEYFEGVNAEDLLNKGIYSPENPPKTAVFESILYTENEAVQYYKLNDYDPNETYPNDPKGLSENTMFYLQDLNYKDKGEERLIYELENSSSVDLKSINEKYYYHIYNENDIDCISLIWVQDNQFFRLNMSLSEAGEDFGVSYTKMYLTENQIPKN